MFEKEFNVAALISLAQKGGINQLQQDELDNWLSENPENLILYKELMLVEKLKLKFSEFNNVNEISGWEKIIQGVNKLSEENVVYKPATRRLWPRMAIAAASMAIIFSIGWWQFAGKQNSVELKFANEIAPGGYGATLTLGNGEKIRLSEQTNGTIANEAGIRLTKTKEGELVYQIESKPTDKSFESNKMNTLTTGNGEKYIVILPDKTKVWMNTASSLTYTTGLIEKGARRVNLVGEAYFEVEKDTRHPFVVESKGQVLEVLGTRFNVMSYDDEALVRTTLLEGSIRLQVKQKMDKSFVLSPGQQSILKDDKITVSPAHFDDALAWKNDYFLFEEESLQSVVSKLARWYNVEFEYENEALKRTSFGGCVPMYESLETVLHLLEKPGTVKFKVKGRKVMVMNRIN